MLNFFLKEWQHCKFHHNKTINNKLILRQTQLTNPLSLVLTKHIIISVYMNNIKYVLSIKHIILTKSFLENQLVCTIIRYIDLFIFKQTHYTNPIPLVQTKHTQVWNRWKRTSLISCLKRWGLLNPIKCRWSRKNSSNKWRTTRLKFRWIKIFINYIDYVCLVGYLLCANWVNFNNSNNWKTID